VSKNQRAVNLTVDPWVIEILVDPISKAPFKEYSEFNFLSTCGFLYSYKFDVPDFRINLSNSLNEWAFGQQEFEEWFLSYLDRGEDDPNFYKNEVHRDSPVYEKFAINGMGRVLDVGGQLGHIRKYLTPNQEYCSIDPFIGAHRLAANKKQLFSTYPLDEPLNLIAGFAEFLPFREMSFQVVNMRSCLDHFFNPQQALLEAFRVLQPGGHLIIGLTLEGQSNKAKIKDLIRPIAGAFFHKFQDHHMWHPTYGNLNTLTKNCGFTLIEEFWQTPDILYALFTRNETHKITANTES
jgi:SAM-dependent methyltransferase